MWSSSRAHIDLGTFYETSRISRYRKSSLVHLKSIADRKIHDTQSTWVINIGSYNGKMLVTDAHVASHDIKQNVTDIRIRPKYDASNRISKVLSA